MEATNIHGITKEMLASAPTFPQAWDQMGPYLNRKIVIFNAGYDLPLLTQTAARYGIILPWLQTCCLMIRATDFLTGGKAQRENYSTFDATCAHFGLTTGKHRALEDAQAARQVFLHLAEE